MSFNSNIPTPTDKTLISVDQLRANFQAINKTFLENHVAINGDFRGRHSAMVFREQSNDPITTATTVALYTKAVGNIPTLFYRPNSNQTPIQMSYPSINVGTVSADPDVWKTDQYSFIAGPFVIYGGYIDVASNGQVVNLSPTTTLIYAKLQKVFDNGGTSLIAPVISGSSFTIAWRNGITGAQKVFYFAIGKP